MEGMTRRRCIAMGGLPVAAGLAAYAARDIGPWVEDAPPRFAAPRSARATLQQRHVPNVPLVANNGDRVRFYDDLVKDRKVVLTFLSSRAPAQSRRVMENLAALQRFFGQRIGWDMFLYSIARNPERDSLAVLRHWARRSGAGLGWRFLTGEPAVVERLRHSLGFASEDPTEDADPAYSVGLLRYGAEPQMSWGHCQALGPARVLAHSMLLDFGAGPAGVDSPALSRFRVASAGAGSLPVWDCHLLLKGI